MVMATPFPSYRRDASDSDYALRIGEIFFRHRAAVAEMKPTTVAADLFTFFSEMKDRRGAFLGPIPPQIQTYGITNKFPAKCSTTYRTPVWDKMYEVVVSLFPWLYGHSQEVVAECGQMLCRALRLYPSITHDLQHVVNSISNEKAFELVSDNDPSLQIFLGSVLVRFEAEIVSLKGLIPNASFAQYKAWADALVERLAVVKWEEVLPRDAPEALPKAE